jgi:putative oxidoreductase
MAQALEHENPLPAVLDRIREEFTEDCEPDTSRIEKTALLVGRALFGGFFLYNGVNHFAQRELMTQYTRSKDVPAANVAVAVSGAMIAAGGLSLITGTRPKIGASLIAGFLLGVTPIMHAFWQHEDPQQRMHEMVHFSKNIAMLGGAMLVAAIPEPWPAATNI